MADTNIEWTDKVWNPVRGCTKVSPGCSSCYAETFAERWRGVKGHAYEQGFDLRLVPEKLDEPLRRKKPTTYFVNSMSDLFQEGVPDAFIDKVFAVMALAPQHTFQVLTKRADRMRVYTSAEKAVILDRLDAASDEWTHATLPDAWPLPNVWLGVSVENQHFADERIPLLLQTPAAVRFISAEPLLGPVDLTPWLSTPIPGGCVRCSPLRACSDHARDELDWVIVGGESGHGARPFDVAWARSIVVQCKAAGVPVFVKQLGAKPVAEPYNTHSWVVKDPGPIPLVLHSKKGGDPAEWPEDLRVREMPALKKHLGEPRA